MEGTTRGMEDLHVREIKLGSVFKLNEHGNVGRVSLYNGINGGGSQEPPVGVGYKSVCIEITGSYPGPPRHHQCGQHCEKIGHQLWLPFCLVTSVPF